MTARGRLAGAGEPALAAAGPLPAARSMPRRRRPERIYPFQITCTACDTRLVAVDREWIVLVGTRPIEMVGSPDGDVHITCPKCGTMVLLDRDLLSLR